MNTAAHSLVSETIHIRCHTIETGMDAKSTPLGLDGKARLKSWNELGLKMGPSVQQEVRRGRGNTGAEMSPGALLGAAA